MCFEQGRSLTFPRCAIALLITKLIIYPRGHGINLKNLLFDISLQIKILGGHGYNKDKNFR